MNEMSGYTSNFQCSDPCTCSSSGASRWPSANRPADGHDEQDLHCRWPRPLSLYALAENVHWSRRLHVDVGAGGRPAAPWYRRRSLDPSPDYHCAEDADAESLRRKPVSFAVFGKPGVDDNRLAAALSAYWGCVHVSTANGLDVGRADAQTMAALRRGQSVYAAATTAQLTAVLGIDTPHVRERGYVLTGLPRYHPEMSAFAQMDAVFTANAPDVLIYMGCSDRYPCDRHSGLALESVAYDHCSRTLRRVDGVGDGDVGRTRRDRGTAAGLHRLKLPIDDGIAARDRDEYEARSAGVVDEIVKQFDAAYVITVDGTRPTDELLRTVKARLMTMPVQRTPLPETVVQRAAPEEHPGRTEKAEAESYGIAETADGEAIDPGERDEGGEDDDVRDDGVDDRGDKYDDVIERTRSMSGFGGLCPVSFSHGLFKLGAERYCARYMGKLYYFAGPEELRLFDECPAQYLRVPSTCVPVRAVFYGPEALSVPAAKAVGHLFDVGLVDVRTVGREHEKSSRLPFVSAIVGSVLETALEIVGNNATAADPSTRDVNAAARNAVGQWIRLHFGISGGFDLYDHGEDVENEHNAVRNEGFPNPSDYNSGPQINALDVEKQLMSLRNYFQLNGMDFVNDLDTCIRVYDEPLTLNNYFQNNMSSKIKKIFRLNLLNKKKTERQFTDTVVDKVRTINKRNKNWIIVKASIDYHLVKKLIAENLNPIQMVFFYDTDPMHKILLYDEVSINNRKQLAWDISQHLKTELWYGTTVERVKYPEFVKNTENNMSNVNYEEHSEKYGEEYEGEYEDEYDVLEDNVLVEHFNEENYDYSDYHLMQIIIPIITERLNQYTNDLIMQWNSLKEQITKEVTTLYMDFNVIQCSPDSITNMLSSLIKNSIYYIKKFLTDNVIDVSTTDNRDTIPTVGMYNGDTSIYCPVRFANGKFSIGSKRHMAVYRNRYYYMSSSNDFKEFVANPNKYASISRSSNQYPKPKVSLLLPFGSDAEDLIKDLVDTFDLTFVDFCKVFKKNILPKSMPMLGIAYEEPTLKHILDEYFIPKDQNEKDYINRLRKYINKESVYLSDEDWMKMNSYFFKINEGICYKNYPNSLMELRYLKENEIDPDVIIEVVVGEDEKQRLAIKAATENWLIYQYTLIDKVIKRDGNVRKDNVDKRSIMFRDKLAAIKQTKKNEKNKTISTKTVDTCETTSDSESPEDTRQKSKLNFYTRFSELTLKQKKIIIAYGLSIADLDDLDDFATLERIDRTVDDECPKPEYLITKCLPFGAKPPSGTVIERLLNTEKTVLEDMRKFAGSSNVPWITVPWSGVDNTSWSGAAALDNVRKALVDSGGDGGGIFETTFDVDLETAENMLRAGEAYLSRFGRWCPVQVHENAVPVQHFYRDCADGQIRPVVYRKHVYYASGPENRDKFARRPSVYVRRPFPLPAPASLPHVPLRIAVVGAPRSGKSHCCRNLCARHGFQLIRIEELAEAYLTAERAARSESDFRTLFRDDALTDAALTAIVKCGMRTTRAMVQGYVLDGYPITEKQFQLLDDSGVILHRVFVMDGSYGRCAENNSRDRASRQRHQHLSDTLLRHRHHMWEAEFAGEPWISEWYGNAVADVTDCDRMDRSLRTLVEALGEYRRNSRGQRPCRLADIPVTRLEREHKTTAVYRYTCPVCRVDDDRFSTARDRESRKRNLVQYRASFYWTCADHVDTFADHADRYVDATAVRPLGPLAVATALDEPDATPGRDRIADEFCTVCALRTTTRCSSSSWNTVYNRGDGSFAAVYAGRTFAFCSSRCRDEFVARPSLYSRCAIRVATPDEVQSVSASRYERLRHAVEGMPALGYLEQTVQPLVGPALAKLTAVRPLYPGLTAAQSAQVFVGLRFGAAAADPDIREHYSIAYDRFIDTCQRFKADIFKLRSLL